LTGALGIIVSTIYGTSSRSIIIDILYCPLEHSLLRSKEYRCILWSPNIHYCVQQSPTCPKPEPSEFSLRPLIPVCKSHLNIILSFTLYLPCLLFPSGFRLKPWTHFILLEVFTQIAFFSAAYYFLPLVPTQIPQQVQTFLQDGIKNTQHFISSDMQNLSK